jgi:predicted nucleotidyltransferase
MEKRLETWSQSLQAALGKDLLGIVLYGSAQRGEHVPGKSDLNLLLVFKQLDLRALAQVSRLTRKLLAKHAPQLVCWTAAELKSAWDVFPLEFGDIAANHRVLFGADLFKKSKADKKNLRFQLEFELRSKLLALRGAWLHLHADRRELEDFLIKAGGSFDYLCRRAQAVFKFKGEETGALFEKLRLLKRKQLRLKLPALQDLCTQMHAAVADTIQKIDAASS